MKRETWTPNQVLRQELNLHNFSDIVVNKERYVVGEDTLWQIYSCLVLQYERLKSPLYMDFLSLYLHIECIKELVSRDEFSDFLVWSDNITITFRFKSSMYDLTRTYEIALFPKLLYLNVYY